MEQNSINIRQQRTFGETFNASFAFFGQEFKPLMTALFIYVIPFILLTVIASSFFWNDYKSIMSEMMVNQQNGSQPGFESISAMLRIYALMIPMYFAYILCLAAMKCTIYGYMKLYVEKGKGNFKVSDVGAIVKKHILKTFLTGVITVLIISMGFGFCIIPGVYLGVSLCVIFAALIIEEKGFGSAFERSFALVKQKWWETLLLIIVMYIIVWIIMMILYIPFMGNMIKSMLTIKDPNEIVESVFSSSFIVMNSLITVVTYLLYSIPTIILGFHYFNLVELKEMPSLKDKIERI